MENERENGWQSSTFKKEEKSADEKRANVGGSTGAWGTVVAFLVLALWMMLPVGVGSGVVVFFFSVVVLFGFMFLFLLSLGFCFCFGSL